MAIILKRHLNDEEKETLLKRHGRAYEPEIVIKTGTEWGCGQKDLFRL
jgi:DNA-binding HxlR family transcriptional regulator